MPLRNYRYLLRRAHEHTSLIHRLIKSIDVDPLGQGVEDVRGYIESIPSIHDHLTARSIASKAPCRCVRSM